ncbi:hypothetical protein TNCV_4649391 [Trichonephila clavipes]|uniref:Uncharacterized protein n=1 Tax=Trichonephila clavipes TaxID=2585209 RepID=A0A8X6STL0_TRICX|nr:hypothetical protein TNCV_4649391 [Trichonephila clavipes]
MPLQMSVLVTRPCFKIMKSIANVASHSDVNLQTTSCNGFPPRRCKIGFPFISIRAPLKYYRILSADTTPTTDGREKNYAPHPRVKFEL